MSTAEKEIISLMQQSLQDAQDGLTSPAEVEMIKAKFDDFDNGEWEQ